MELQILGAAQTVTGSRFLLHEENVRVLIDAGLFQGPRELRHLNWDPFPLPPDSLAGVLFTHAHIDHTGYAPRLIRQGYPGPLFCTEATAALLSILWPDAAHLQEEEAAYANKTGYSRHRPALPLYTLDDAYQGLRQVQAVSYRTPLRIGPWRFEFHPAGHILGSSFIYVTHESTHGSVLFSGDLGRYDSPFMKAPEPPPRADWLVLESTYGDRLHDLQRLPDQLADRVREVHRRRGVLLIPAFAIGRTQILLYYLARLHRAGEIPGIPVFVDSPMATDVTALYIQFGDELNLDVNLLADRRVHPLRLPGLRFTRTVHDSKQLNRMDGPMIVISASGMCTGGRILHHLKHRLGRPENLVLFVGYQAEETLGRELLEGAEEVRIHGERIPVRAEVATLEGLSAHGDYRDLIRWVQAMPEPPRNIALVHGEPESMRSLAQRLERECGVPTVIPARNQTLSLTP